MKKLINLIVLGAVFASLVFGQTNRGGISGTVTDSNIL
jgi:hypothetical protein